MREYRLTVRLNLENQQERAVAEFLTHLDCENFGSRNRFAIAALQIIFPIWIAPGVMSWWRESSRWFDLS